MSTIDEQGRTEPPVSGEEIAVLEGFLDFHRATLAWKCQGLDSAGLSATIGSSPMTLGGILKHLALVEQGWFWRSLYGRERTAPWDAVDWDADPDWEWRTAREDSPAELLSLWQREVERARACVAEAVADGDGLEQLATRKFTDGRVPNLRWIMLHMIEEYSRHNGHADLLRESVDGETGE